MLDHPLLFVRLSRAASCDFETAERSGRSTLSPSETVQRSDANKGKVVVGRVIVEARTQRGTLIEILQKQLIPLEAPTVDSKGRFLSAVRLLTSTSQLWQGKS